MATKQIHQLTEVTTLADDELLHVEITGDLDKKITKANLLKEVTASINNINYSKLDNPLLHAFKKNKLSAVSMPTDTSADITTVRSTTATYVDINGTVRTAAIDTPREELTGWLFEGASTSLALFPTEFDNAAWNKIGSTIIPNDTVAPDGELTADTLQLAASTTSRIEQSGVLASSTEYSLSYYIKHKSGDTDLRLFISDDAFGAQFSPTITATSEWVRHTLTATTGAAITTSSFGIRNTSGALAGDIFIWLAQTEESPFATSGITDGARSADNISFPTQDNFRESEGCIFFKADVIGDMGAFQYMLDITDGSALNRITIFRTSSNFIRVRVLNADGLGADFTTSITMVQGVEYYLVLNYKENDIEFFINGISVGSDAAVDMPTGLNLINVGGNFTLGQQLQGHIQDLRFYDRNLTLDEIKFLGSN